MTTDFTYAAYRNLLETLLAQGYETKDFHAVDPSKQHLLVRHDIDMSLERAIPIAEIEHEMNISATYFVMLRTEFYNFMSMAGTQSIMRILELGHTVGLHLDTALYSGSDETLNEEAGVECSVLEAMMKKPISVISFHRPAKEYRNYADTVAGRIHAYQPKFFSKMGYSSDSTGEWRYGHPLDHSAVRNKSSLQLLTHPIWWSGEFQPASVKLKNFLAERQKQLDEELGMHCMTHKPELRKGESHAE